jgi:hypothetical protein
MHVQALESGISHYQHCLTMLILGVDLCSAHDREKHPVSLIDTFVWAEKTAKLKDSTHR